jgi:hypothetical protein
MDVSAYWRRAPAATRRVLAAYIALSVARLTVGVTIALTERHRHPIVVAVALLLVIALLVVLLRALVRQRRWAWVVLVGSDVLALIPFPGGSAGALLIVSNLADLLLLVSPPMWRHVWRQPSARASVSPTDGHAV